MSKGKKDKADTILCLLKTHSPSFYRAGWGGGGGGVRDVGSKRYQGKSTMRMMTF